jgi:hypothetical protein
VYSRINRGLASLEELRRMFFGSLKKGNIQREHGLRAEARP